MRVSSHIALSTVIAGACYVVTKSPEITTATFLSGWLVDADHIIDAARGKLALKDWFGKFSTLKSLTVLLHSYELILLSFLAFILSHSPLIGWATIAYATHIFADFCVYQPNVWWYSLIWRANHSFDAKYAGHSNRITTLQGLLLVFAVYLLGYVNILSPYKVVLAPPSVGHQVFNALQWFIPTVLFIFTASLFVKILRPLLNIRFWTSIGIIVVALFVALEINGARGTVGSWSSLGLCMLVLMTVTNAVENKLGSVKAAILGLEMMFLTMATFEIVYQIGLVFYHNFFGEPKFDFFVVVCQNLAWIVPGIIMLLLAYSRGIKLFHWNKIATVCLAIAVVACIVWFATKMTIPLMFYGIKGPYDAHPNPSLLAVSRGVQGFLCAAIVACFIDLKALHEKTI